MSFKKVFERHVNESMQDNKAGRAPAVQDEDADLDMKKECSPCEPQEQTEESDWSEKTDRPPRFSTLFGVAPPLPPRAFESYPEPKRRSGVFLPTPLFVIFAVILVFESTLLFAYTVIGLYNNLPARLVPSSTDCAPELMNRLPAVNIAPKFMIPQVPVVQTVTVFESGALSDSLPTATITTSRSEASITATASTVQSSPIATSQAAAAVASDLLGMLRPIQSTLLTSTSTLKGPSIVTVTASTPASTTVVSMVAALPSTVRSTLLLTVDAAGSTLTARPTVTVTTAVSAAQASADSAVSSLSVASSVQTALTSLSATLTPDAVLASTTLATSAMSTPAVVETTTAVPSVSPSSS